MRIVPFFKQMGNLFFSKLPTMIFTDIQRIILTFIAIFSGFFNNLFTFFKSFLTFIEDFFNLINLFFTIIGDLFK
jgi:hypothetical protein